MNRTHMHYIPTNRYERAAWVEEALPDLLKQVPLHAGLAGVAELEAKLFPRMNYFPLDPTCPECGQETEDGRIDRAGDVFRIQYDCGHTFEVSEAELHARARVDGRPA